MSSAPPPPAHRLLRERPVRRFEARFFPTQASKDDYVVVGHVIWDASGMDARPRVEPALTLSGAGAPAAMLATLRHLVLMAGCGSFDRLSSLGNGLWSFVEVETSLAGLPDEAA